MDEFNTLLILFVLPLWKNVFILNICFPFLFFKDVFMLEIDSNLLKRKPILSLGHLAILFMLIG